MYEQWESILLSAFSLQTVIGTIVIIIVIVIVTIVIIIVSIDASSFSSEKYPENKLAKSHRYTAYSVIQKSFFVTSRI